MLKNLIKLYSLTICCISATVLLVIFALAMEDTTDLLLTRCKYRSYFSKFASIEAFIDAKKPKERVALKNMNRSDLMKKMKKESETYIRMKHNQAIERLVGKLGWVISGLLFWISHFILYRQEK